MTKNKSTYKYINIHHVQTLKMFPSFEKKNLESCMHVHYKETTLKTENKLQLWQKTRLLIQTQILASKHYLGRWLDIWTHKKINTHALYTPTHRTCYSKKYCYKSKQNLFSTFV